MKDSLGVNRGHCKDCREDECKYYKVQKNTDLCGYCEYYPVKHAKIRSEEKLLTKTQTAEEQAHQSRLNAVLGQKPPGQKTCGHKPPEKTPWTKTALAKNPPDKNPPDRTFFSEIL